MEWDLMKPVDVTGRQARPSWNFARATSSITKTLAAHGEPGMAEKAATLAQMLGEPAGRRFLVAGACYLESFGTWGRA